MIGTVLVRTARLRELSVRAADGDNHLCAPVPVGIGPQVAVQVAAADANEFNLFLMKADAFNTFCVRVTDLDDIGATRGLLLEH